MEVISLSHKLEHSLRLVDMIEKQDTDLIVYVATAKNGAAAAEVGRRLAATEFSSYRLIGAGRGSGA